MIFPNKLYERPGHYLDEYAAQVTMALASVSRSALEAATAKLQAAVRDQKIIFACGNGGSAAIANHLACDCLKGIRTDTTLKPKLHSLSTNVEILTAIANDLAYDQVYSYQLESLASRGDVLVAISSSGCSQNIINAIRHGRSIGMITIALTGFEGGGCRDEADISLHTHAKNYGVIEDVHQSIMHVLAQFLRHSNMSDQSLLGVRRF